MTEFKIKCYKKTSGKWNYIGIYTPDFLIIKRKDGVIHKVIVVETKGQIYAKDPVFKDIPHSLPFQMHQRLRERDRTHTDRQGGIAVFSLQ